MPESIRSGRSAGRQKGQANASRDSTRDKILDAAEYLFGERTFDTVSLRDITRRANVTLALASYHFGTKERLCAEVVHRRAEVLNQMRRARLSELEASGAITTAAIIDAFMHPLFEMMTSGDEGWESYVMLLTKLGQTNRWLELVRENFDETAWIFLAQLRKTLPDLSEPDLIRGFALAIAAMLNTLGRNRRVDTISAGTISSSDLAASYDVLVRFVVKGLEGLGSSGQG